MATYHQELLDAGARVFGVSVDSPEQQSAMIDKLNLAFPMLSDPDRSGAIEPLDVVDDVDPRGIARPAMVLFAPGGDEAWRFVSRDYADRLPLHEVLSLVRASDWAPTTQQSPELGRIQPGETAMPLDQLPSYLRGARWTALALGLRHKALGPELVNDSKALVAEMDRFIEASSALSKSKKSDDRS